MTSHRDKTWRENMMDELKQECKVPQDWQFGPVKNNQRKHTDVFCCLIFVFFMLFLLGTAIWVFYFTTQQNV